MIIDTNIYYIKVKNFFTKTTPDYFNEIIKPFVNNTSSITDTLTDFFNPYQLNGYENMYKYNEMYKSVYNICLISMYIEYKLKFFIKDTYNCISNYIYKEIILYYKSDLEEFRIRLNKISSSKESSYKKKLFFEENFHVYKDNRPITGTLCNNDYNWKPSSENNSIEEFVKKVKETYSSIIPKQKNEDFFPNKIKKVYKILPYVRNDGKYYNYSVNNPNHSAFYETQNNDIYEENISKYIPKFENEDISENEDIKNNSENEDIKDNSENNLDDWLNTGEWD